jgi:hypothetical protein
MTQSAGRPTAGTPADVLQAYFNMVLALSQQAIGNVKETGYTPQMVWDPGAYNGVGGFVPTGNAVETMALVQNRLNTNRAQVSSLATVAAQAGMVPQVGVDENGYLFQEYDPMTGRPLYQETTASRAQRQSAGQAIGFVQNDLQQAPVRSQGMKVGAAPGENMMRDQAPVGLSQQAPPAPPAPPASAQPNGGFVANPAAGAVSGEGGFVSNTGVQFPSGRDANGNPQGSAYTPQDMGTPANQDWLAAHPFVPPQGPTPGAIETNSATLGVNYLDRDAVAAAAARLAQERGAPVTVNEPGYAPVTFGAGGDPENVKILLGQQEYSIPEGESH